MQYQLENFSDFIGDGLPLMQKHWEEIAHYKDIPLKPDLDNYKKIADSGAMRIFTARGAHQELLGYSVFFVKNNLHYSDSKQAVQDVLYIDKEKRGFGAKFILWCDQQLKDEGVQVVYHHVKTAHNFGPLLERFGYELVDYIYGKRLDTQGVAKIATEGAI